MKANICYAIAILFIVLAFVSCLCSYIWDGYALETVFKVLATVWFISGTACGWIGEHTD